MYTGYRLRRTKFHVTKRMKIPLKTYIIITIFVTRGFDYYYTRVSLELSLRCRNHYCLIDLQAAART